LFKRLVEELKSMMAMSKSRWLLFPSSLYF